MSSTQQLPYHLSPARAHIPHDQTQTLPPFSPTAPASPACRHTHFSHNLTMSHRPAMPETASSSQYRHLVDSGYRPISVEGRKRQIRRPTIHAHLLRQTLVARGGAPTVVPHV